MELLNINFFFLVRLCPCAKFDENSGASSRTLEILTNLISSLITNSREHFVMPSHWCEAMVLHARGEGVPCSSYSTSYVGHDQSRLMEILPNRLSHHGPPSLLSFVATFLFMDFPLCPDWELCQTIGPMQGARNLLSNKSSFAQNTFQLRELCPFFPVTAICPVLISAHASPMFET